MLNQTYKNQWKTPLIYRAYYSIGLLEKATNYNQYEWALLAWPLTSLVLAWTSFLMVLRSIPGPEAAFRCDVVLLFTSFVMEEEDTDIFSFSLLCFFRSVSDDALRFCLLVSKDNEKKINQYMYLYFVNYYLFVLVFFSAIFRYLFFRNLSLSVMHEIALSLRGYTYNQISRMIIWMNLMREWAYFCSRGGAAGTCASSPCLSPLPPCLWTSSCLSFLCPSALPPLTWAAARACPPSLSSGTPYTSLIWWISGSCLVSSA